MGSPIQFSPTWRADVLAVGHLADGKDSSSQLWVNALHIFPDLVFLYQAAGKAGPRMLSTGGQVLQLMGDETSAWRCLPIQKVRFRDRERLLESAGIPGGHK
jgi:hypothetical protein